MSESPENFDNGYGKTVKNQGTPNAYLDHNATAPMKAAVISAMAEWMGMPTNPSSVHGPGRKAREGIETARKQVAGLVSLPAEEAWRVIFTSGATESNNTAHAIVAKDANVWVSGIEHAAVLQACDRGAGYRRMPVTPDGMLDLDALDGALKDGQAPDLFSLMAVNNETGVIQPVAEATSLLHPHGAIVHCDAVQAAGRIKLDFHALDVDMMALSSHKMAGPQGVGALILKKGEGFHGLIHGGGQEQRRRAGTENVAGIVGFGRAAELAMDFEDEQHRLRALRDDLEDRLKALCGTHIRIIGENAPRVANTSCITLPGIPAERALMALDLGGISVSSGSACSSGKVSASHVLTAMGLDEREATSAIRVSFGWNNDANDVDRFMQVWTEFYNRVKERL